MIDKETLDKTKTEKEKEMECNNRTQKQITCNNFINTVSHWKLGTSGI